MNVTCAEVDEPTSQGEYAILSTVPPMLGTRLPLRHLSDGPLVTVCRCNYQSRCALDLVNSRNEYTPMLLRAHVVVAGEDESSIFSDSWSKALLVGGLWRKNCPADIICAMLLSFLVISLLPIECDFSEKSSEEESK